MLGLEFQIDGEKNGPRNISRSLNVDFHAISTPYELASKEKEKIRKRKYIKANHKKILVVLSMYFIYSFSCVSIDLPKNKYFRVNNPFIENGRKGILPYFISYFHLQK